MSFRHRALVHAGPHSQQGAATLVVVMILFFVISMVAAYTNRNLIFEQRTASNQQRSSRALEAADAGVEWALAMLNTGRITAACQTSTSAADTDFRARYLEMEPFTGNITPRKWISGGIPVDLYPTCVYSGTSWSCDCPTAAAPAVAAPSGTDIHPAFRVRFRRVCTSATAPDSACATPPATPIQPGIIHIDVNGCTTLNDDCLRFHDEASPGVAVANEGRATIHVVAALKPALPTPPSAALTAKGLVDVTSALTVVNAEPIGAGLTIVSGDNVNVPIGTLQGPPGTPAARTIVANDSVLNALSNDRMFSNTFGLWRNSYRDQPAAITMDCTGGCTAADVRAKVSLNPGRVLWLAGDVNFDSAGDIGSATQPVLLNVTGNITFTSPLTIFGMLYSQAGTWTISGGGTVIGAVVAEQRIEGTAATTSIIRNTGVLTRLRTITGSFVRVPGTWKDFES